MMDLIAGAFGTLKTASEITQGLLALKTDAAVSSKAVELNRVIADVQHQLFAAQTDYAALSGRIRELEADIVKFKNWEQEKQRYQLHPLAEGTLVYRVKPEMKDSEPVHDICPNCYEQGIKSILQKTQKTAGHHAFSCPGCKHIFLAEKINNLPLVAPSRSTWSGF